LYFLGLYFVQTLSKREAELILNAWNITFFKVKLNQNKFNFKLFFRTYSKTLPENVLVETRTERPCVGYATLFSKSATQVYRYRMKDVDCKVKAPFICKYNPGNLLWTSNWECQFSISLIHYRTSLLLKEYPILLFSI
jgi:hypothetical protein